MIAKRVREEAQLEKIKRLFTVETVRSAVSAGAFLMGFASFLLCGRSGCGRGRQPPQNFKWN